MADRALGTFPCVRCGTPGFDVCAKCELEAEEAEVIQAGIHNWPADYYHAERDCLTQSGAKLLLPPSLPAKFRHWRDNPEPHKVAYDLGHGAHRLLLGTGPDLVRVDAPDWRTKAAREKRDVARAEGAVPLLVPTYERIIAMAEALHQQVPGIFDPNLGDAEQTMVWRDSITGVMCKAMADWMSPANIIDYKTCNDASDDAISRALHNYGYHLQAAWYLDGAETLDLGQNVFAFCFQEKDPPYLARLVRLDATALSIGRSLMRQAREIYRDCTDAGVWPGYDTTHVAVLGLPHWVTNRWLMEDL